jgi:hypothetical protein
MGVLAQSGSTQHISINDKCISAKIVLGDTKRAPRDTKIMTETEC